MLRGICDTKLWLHALCDFGERLAGAFSVRAIEPDSLDLPIRVERRFWIFSVDNDTYKGLAISGRLCDGLSDCSLQVRARDRLPAVIRAMEKSPEELPWFHFITG